VAVSLNNLGDVKLQAGDQAGALAASQEGLDILRKLGVYRGLRVYGGVYADRIRIAEIGAPQSAPDSLDRAAPPLSIRRQAVEAARRRRRGGRLSLRRMRRRARPKAASGKLSRRFLSDNRNSRYIESRAFSSVSPGRSSRPRPRKKWRKRDSGSPDR
jgi:hypothetical protein